MAETTSSVPVLKINYQELCDRLEAKKKRFSKGNGRVTIVKPSLRDKRERSNTNEESRHYKDSNKKGTTVPSRLAANILKKSLEENTEGAWQEAWSQWSRLKEEIISLVSSHTKFQETIHQCSLLEEFCFKLFAECTDLTFMHDLVTKTWRMVHYPVIDTMRKDYKQSSNHEKEDSMKQFFSQLMDFYNKLVEFLQKKYGSGEEHSPWLIPNPSQHSSRSHQRKVRQAINVVHQCFIFLGDVSRYTEEISTHPQWSKPRSYYLKAIDLVPKNGHPYNLLAVVAINSHRRLDAIYYYVRSLCSKNVFLSANDSLTALFDETARKAMIVENEKKLMESKERRKPKKKNNKKLAGAKSKRREIWIMPGTKQQKEECDFTVTKASSLPPSCSEDGISSVNNTEHSRNLINSFLIVHGKLYSRIGIETFDQSKANLICLLKTHLHSILPPLVSHKDGEKLMMMVTINVFSVHQKLTEIKDNDSSDSFLASLSLSFGFQFVSVITEYITSTVVTDQQPSCMAILGVVLPTIRVWMKWMVSALPDWMKLVHTHPMAASSFRDFLCGLAELLNFLSELGLENSINVEDESKLWEDKFMAGFTPLGVDIDHLSYPNLFSLADQQHHKQSLYRIKDTLTIASVMAACNDPVVALVWEKESGKFSVTMDISLPKPVPPTLQNEDSSDSDNGDNGDDSDNGDDGDSGDNGDNGASGDIGDNDTFIDGVSSQLQMLKLEKEKLSKQMSLQLQAEQASQVLLDEIKAKEDIVLTVKPKYLVPDTNCFIDCLDQLKHLVTSSHFVLAVPLTVMTELDGLSKGNQITKEKGNATSTTTTTIGRNIALPAQLASKYLCSEIGSPYLKVLTSQGNLLSSLTLTNELTDKATNDDLILSSCIKLHERVGSMSCSTVVLLTDDRNLRVKSHTSHMPVKDMPSFMDLFLQMQS